MTVVTKKLMYELMKRIHGEVADTRGDIRELKIRMTQVDFAVSNLDVLVSNIRVELANMSARLDRRDEVAERILRRPDLAEA